MKEYMHTFVTRFQTRVNVPVGIRNEELDIFEERLDAFGVQCDLIDKKSAFYDKEPRLYLEIPMMLDVDIEKALHCIEAARRAAFGNMY
jgi:hypothetical protein